MAFAGKIDLVQGVYQDAAIAVLDDHGCSRYTEKLSGPVGGKRPFGKSTMKALAGPFVGLYQKVHHAFDRKCDVFYSGLGGAARQTERQGGRRTRGCGFGSVGLHPIERNERSA